MDGKATFRQQANTAKVTTLTERRVHGQPQRHPSSFGGPMEHKQNRANKHISSWAAFYDIFVGRY